MDKSEAKKKMLGSLSKEMRDAMGENYKEGLKDKMMKVTVAGDDEESVEKGLDKAKEILKKKLGPMEDMMDEDDDYGEVEEGIPAEAVEAMDEDAMDEDYDDESPLEELAEEEAEEESPEELKAKIQELQEKLAMLEE